VIEAMGSYELLIRRSIITEAGHCSNLRKTYHYTFFGHQYAKEVDDNRDAKVYDSLHSVVGRRRISRFPKDLAKPHVVGQDLSVGNAAMTTNEIREAEAAAWSHGTLVRVAARAEGRARLAARQ
jgi:hypothetical protein